MKPLTIEQALSLLEAAPPRIATATAGLTQAQLHAKPDEWSANDVLAHLRSCADVCKPLVRTVLSYAG